MIGIYQNGKSGGVANLPRMEVEKLARSTAVYGDEAETLLELLTHTFNHHPVMRKRRKGVGSYHDSFRNKELSQFSIYPNPTSGRATVVYELSGEQSARLQIFDFSGRLVKEKALSTEVKQLQLDLNFLHAGIYHFSVILKDERVLNGKLVIAK